VNGINAKLRDARRRLNRRARYYLSAQRAQEQGLEPKDGIAVHVKLPPPSKRNPRLLAQLATHLGKASSQASILQACINDYVDNSYERAIDLIERFGWLIAHQARPPSGKDDDDTGSTSLADRAIEAAALLLSRSNDTREYYRLACNCKTPLLYGCTYVEAAEIGALASSDLARQQDLLNRAATGRKAFARANRPTSKLVELKAQNQKRLALKARLAKAATKEQLIIKTARELEVRGKNKRSISGIASRKTGIPESTVRRIRSRNRS